MRILLYFIFVFFVSITFSQQKENLVGESIKALQQNELLLAKQKIDEAIEEKTLADSASTWYFRGFIYKELFLTNKDDILSSNYREEGIRCFEKFFKKAEGEDLGLIPTAKKSYEFLLASKEEEKQSKQKNEGVLIKKAHKHYLNYEFAHAIPIYEKALSKKEDSLAVKRLAECYYNINDYKNAEKYYARAVELYPNNAEVFLQYGKLLKMNSKPDQAKEVFIVYSSKNPKDTLGNKYVLSCDKVKSWTVAVPSYEVNNMKSLNSNFAEFSPVPFGNGIAFVTDKFSDQVMGEVSGLNEKPYLSVQYVAKDTDSSYAKAKSISKNINNDFHNGPISFNQSQDIAFFTRVEPAKGTDKDFVNKPQLYYSVFADGKWQKAEEFSHNDKSHAYAHPAVSPDGNTLYFVSDMPGSVGGKDIWFSVKDETGWAKPQNVGRKINTKGDEMFPYAYGNDKLYFSSNTHVGLGGLDVFYSQRVDGKWLEPKNLKAPLNSTYDDFGAVFTSDTTGFLSSNREGGMGDDDIYSFKLVLKEENAVEISGVFIYSELNPAIGARIKLLDENDNELAFTYTDEHGKFHFENLDPKKNYMFALDENNPNLSPESILYITNSDGKRVLELTPDAQGHFKYRPLHPEVINALPLLAEQDVSLSKFTMFGLLYDQLPGDYKDRVEIILESDDGQIVLTAFTDANGKFNFTELPNDKNYNIRLKNSSDDLKMVFLDGKGDVQDSPEKKANGHFYYKTKEEFIANSVFGKVYEKLPGDFSKKLQVELVDDDGNIVMTTFTDENGNFDFQNLPADKNYKIRLAGSEEDIKMVLLNEEGEVKSIAEKGKDGEFKTQKSNLPGIFGNVYQKLPGDYASQLQVQLIDDAGVIVYSTFTDEHGNFNFKNLPPDRNFTIKVVEAPADVQMALLNELGEMETAKHNGDGNFSYVFKEKFTMMGNFYQTLPGDFKQKLEVLLLDEDGNLVMKGYTDDKGNFEFKNLPTDKQYFVKLASGEDATMILMDEFGGVKDVVTKDEKGAYNTASSYTKSHSFFGQAYKEKPGDVGAKMRVLLVDETGVLVMSTSTNGEGKFKFEMLPPDKNYNVKFESGEDIKLLVLDQNGKPKIDAVKTEKNTFEIKPQPVETNSLFGQAFAKLAGDVNDRIQVLLLDDEGNIVMTTYTDEFGKFKFEKLPADKNLRVKFNTEEDINMIITDQIGNEKGQTKDGEALAMKSSAPSNIPLYGRVYQKLPGDVNNKVQVLLLDDEGNIVMTTFTDENGNFKFDKLPSDKNFKIKFNTEEDVNLSILDKFGNEIASPEKGKNGDFTYDYLVAQPTYVSVLTENDQVLKINVKDQLSIIKIYFDYDKANLKENSVSELEKMNKFLKKNPHLNIIIEAHTDSRGTSEYNKALSERRAKAAQQYLVSKGADKKKVNTKGFGETKPVNNCVDGVECAEEEHTKNRRVEIKLTAPNK